jgi:ribulose 1,5-bisphosphate carboxylase large subunit-like protein
VPTDFLNLAFAASGADVMYPGGRAKIKDEERNYEAADQNLIEASRKKYRSHLDDLKFIPTVAGGITPGQLHIFYELYGPNVSFFLGGAVALHADGPGAGARLCKHILNFAADFRDRHPEAGQEIESIPASLQKEIAEKYGGRSYLEPSVFFDSNEGVVNKFSFER